MSLANVECWLVEINVTKLPHHVSDEGLSHENYFTDLRIMAQGNNSWCLR